MILSTQTDVTQARFGDIKSIEMLAQAGFDAIDFSMFDSAAKAWMFEDGFQTKVKQIKSTAENNGVYFNQAHAPFPPMKWNDDEYTAFIWPRVIRSIEIAGMLGVKNIVVHPVVFPERQLEQNVEMYLKLAPFAQRAGVKIALENMWGWDGRSETIRPNVCSVASELAAYADALDDSRFTVCLDLGHISLVGEHEKNFILTLGGKRLTCLHVHDNDCVHDSHTAPFTMNLPWDDIAKGLAQIDYQGDITLEADNFIVNMPDELVPSGLKFMHDAGRCFISRIEKYKEKSV